MRPMRPMRLNYGLSARASRWVRAGLVVASGAASIATFGGDPGWAMHQQLSSPMSSDVVLSSSAPAFTDVYRGQGSGTGAQNLAFDGAIELRPASPLATPVAVRLRFVPMDPAAAVQESTVYVSSRQVFTAVDFNVVCQPSVACVNEGTMEVAVVTPADLGSSTINLHWVTTASLSGRGASAPADAILRLTQP